MASSEGSETLDRLVTESRRADADYASLSTQELVELMNAEDASVPAAVGAAAGAIATALDAIVERLAAGGRLVYAGAGTSGGIAALDAEECEATFSTAPGQVVALVAGADAASAEAREAAEDDWPAGKRAAEQLDVSSGDAVVGVSASGRTPYVLGALEAAAAAGALTVALVSADDSPLARAADHELVVVVGPEVVSGSTRLTAGTAQKLVLNTISTVAMIRLGKTYGDLMVDLRASNGKLEARARRIVREATGVSDDEARAALEAAGGSAKVAVVALLAELDPEAARTRLEQAGGNIEAALAP
jgi:N-acetylmuramic acid 6-phosphate etherase